MEEAETKNDALDKVAELEDELGRTKEQLQETEHAAYTRQVDLENQLMDVRKERDDLKQRSQKVENEYSTLRRNFSSKEEESRKRQSFLEAKIQELEADKLRLASTGSTSSLVSSNSSIPSSISSNPPVTMTSAPPPPPPPPPPPGPMLGTSIITSFTKKLVKMNYFLSTQCENYVNSFSRIFVKVTIFL